MSKTAPKADTCRKTEEIAYRSKNFRKNKFYIDEKYKKSEQTSNQMVLEVFQTVFGVAERVG